MMLALGSQGVQCSSFLLWGSQTADLCALKRSIFLVSPFSVHLPHVAFVSHIFLSHCFLKCLFLKVRCSGSSPLQLHALSLWNQANLSGMDWRKVFGPASPSSLSLCSWNWRLLSHPSYKTVLQLSSVYSLCLCTIYHLLKIQMTL